MRRGERCGENLKSRRNHIRVCLLYNIGMPHKDFLTRQEYLSRPDVKQKDYERSNVKIICGCGGRHTAKSKTKHERTKKHLKWSEEEEKNIFNSNLERIGKNYF
jgi:hypothetical protein